MMRPYILQDYSPASLIEDRKRIAELYHQYGVVIFPRLLAKNEEYLRFVGDLSTLFDEILGRHTDSPVEDEIGAKLTLLNQVCPLDGKILTNLGTQPNKLYSFNRIKYSDWLHAILAAIFGDDSLLATPQAGDTLHFFAPGKVFHRYNLPPHQDYHYLMQSPVQTTCYLGISQYHENVGGLRLWEGSHQEGIWPSSKNEYGSYQVNDSDRLRRDYQVFDFFWTSGDFGIFNSLLVHASIPNETVDHSRIVQIFRFSDLNNDQSRRYDYMSTSYPRDGVLFPQHHPELFIS